MLSDRRQFLKGLGSFAFSVPATAMLAGCNTADVLSVRQKVAMILPLSGRGSAIGGNMERAARVAVSENDQLVELVVFDTASDDAGAAAAARKALQSGAKMVLGPVFRGETRAAASAIGGKVPLVAFTNDGSLVNQGAFIFGVTSRQSVAAILGYAKSKGLRRIAIVTQPGEGSALAARAAQDLANENGITITAVVEGGQESLSSEVRSAGGGKSPDAILLPGGGEALIRDAESISGSGVRLLGTEQWLGSDLASRKAFSKAWFAAPVPNRSFQEAFGAQQSATPGILAGLAYDAVGMARTLAGSGDMNAQGVTRSSGFNGALGSFRFLPDGSCERSLSILAFEGGREKVIATSQQS